MVQVNSAANPDKQLYLGHAAINIGMSSLEEQIQELRQSYQDSV